MSEVTQSTVEHRAERSRTAELLANPQYISFISRRHSSYDRGADRPFMRGFLDKPGLKAAQERGFKTADMIPAGAEVTVDASPSFMMAKNRGPVLDVRRLSDEEYQALQERLPEDFKGLSRDELFKRLPLDPDQLNQKLTPQRAVFSAREDVKILHQKGLIEDEPKAAIDRNGQIRVVGVQSGEDLVHLDPRLGDFLEGAEGDIDQVYAAIKKDYGGLGPIFFGPLAKDELTEDVDRAMLRVKGLNGPRSAQEVTEYFMEKSKELTQRSDQQGGRKEVKVLRQHGDGQDAFLYQLVRFLNAEGNHELADRLFDRLELGGVSGYNQGFEIHLDKNKGQTIITFEASEKAPETIIEVPYPLNLFRDFLIEINVKKTAKLGVNANAA